VAPRVSRGPTVLSRGTVGSGYAPSTVETQARARYARCVDLVVVRIVDDLPLRDKPGRGFGELLEQHDRQGKVAAREYPTLLFTGEGVDLREIAFRETGGSHHDVRAVFECGQDVALGGIRFGVLDKDVAGRGECLCGRGVNATR